ncbi:hypothetical protein AB3480_00660 [Rhizobium mongolense]|uniref:hypothetical protein n=1 Tax=Rhizobium mongolense TaxID=57676 RepID=UPI0034A29BA4
MMSSPFDTIIQAAEAARSQFSILSTEADNAEVLKEMATKIFRAFYGLVEDANGDPDIISTWIDGVPSDIDYAFADVIERREENVTMFRPRRGLGAVVQGARL